MVKIVKTLDVHVYLQLTSLHLKEIKQHLFRTRTTSTSCEHWTPLHSIDCVYFYVVCTNIKVCIARQIVAAMVVGQHESMFAIIK